MSRNRLPRSVRNQFRRIRGSVSRTGNSVNAYVRATQMRAQQETQNRLNAVQQRARTEARELERASRERLRQQSIERDSSSRFQRVWSFISGAVWTIRNAIDIFTIFDYRNNGSNGADSSNNSNNTNNEQNSSANFPSDGGQVLGKKPFPSDDRNAGNG